jgi:hypothetical protein
VNAKYFGRRALVQLTGEITQEIYNYLPLLACWCSIKLVNRAACNLHMQIDIMVIEANEQEKRTPRSNVNLSIDRNQS